MPPPTTITSYSFISSSTRANCRTRMREYARTQKMYRVVPNPEQRQRSPVAPVALAAPAEPSRPLTSFALLLELDDRSVRRDLDLAFDDGAFGDGDGARTDAASDHRR